MANWKRINKNLQYKLGQMARFGQSKHEAKQEARAAYLREHGDLRGYNPSKVEGIYGIKTMETYRAAMEDFSKWCADKGVNNATRITKDHAIAYLREREADGKSAWTISRDMSAINKVFDYDLNKKDLGLKIRHERDITRSRQECNHDKYAHAERYADQMTFTAACGCRRQSIEQVRYEDLRWNNGRVVAVHLVEKGGKERVAPVLNEYKDKLTEIINTRFEGKQETDRIFPEKYSTQIDNHAIRAEYAANLLHQLEHEREQGQPLCQGDYEVERLCNLRGRDRSDDPQYRGHDRDICGMVSGAMGHNRLEVVFSSYNYKM